MTGIAPLVALGLFACERDPGARPPPQDAPPDTPTWPEAPTTVYSSTASLSPTFTPDGTALVWFEPDGSADPIGPFSRLDLRTGEIERIADDARTRTWAMSADGRTIAFVRPDPAAPELSRLFVWSDGVEAELGTAPSVTWSVAAPGTVVWFTANHETSAWSQEHGVVPLGDGEVLVGLPEGILGWYAPGTQVLTLAVGNVTILYPGVPSPTVTVGWSGAIVAHAYGVSVAWPDATSLVQILPPAECLSTTQVAISDEGATVVVLGEAWDASGVLWVWTRGGPDPARVLVDVAEFRLLPAGVILAHGEDGRLWRVSGGEAELLQADVCQWVEGYGRVAWIAGDCVDTGTAEVLGPTGAVSAPFAARLGPLEVGSDGVVVVDGAPEVPGTAWWIDAGRDPEAIVDDVVGAGATAWGWMGVRDHPDGEVSVLGAGWETAPGSLSWGDVGAWHLAAMMQRGSEFQLDVVNLAR